MTRILLVDDVKLFRHLEAAVLAWRGYTIEEASSGAEALDKIRATPPALVICDLYMPGMSGLEVCQQIKKDPSLKNIPVIMVTSSSREEDIRKAVQAGCDDYLTKPLEDATLVRKVEDLLGASGLRRFPRISTSMQVSFEDFKGIFFEYTRDLSRTGVFIEMNDPLPVETKLRLSFSLPPPHDHPITAWGRVVRRVDSTPESIGGMGISFIRIDDQSQAVIDELVAALDELDTSSGVFSRLSYQKDVEDSGKPAPKEPQVASLLEERNEVKSSFEELQREHLRLSAILTLMESLHAEKSPKMLLAVALDVLGDLLGAAACGIFLHDPVREQLIPANSRGLPATVLDHIPMEGPLAKAIEEQAIQVPDPPWAIGNTLSELLAATPILHGQRCLGLVTIHKLFNQKQTLKLSDHQLLESLGRHLGLALVNAVAREAAVDNLGINEILKVTGIGR